MAQTECIVRVLGKNKFDSSIDSVKYAMILSTDKRKTDPMISDQVRHKPGSATTCDRFYKLCSENKDTYQISTFLFLSVLVKPSRNYLFVKVDNFGHPSYPLKGGLAQWLGRRISDERVPRLSPGRVRSLWH